MIRSSMVSAVRICCTESDMAGMDEGTLNDLCRKAVDANPKAVADYKAGKVKALKSMVGFVMKESRGKADASLAEKKILEILS